MTVATDIRDKCIEIEAELAKCAQMCVNGSQAYWPIADAAYTDWKSICLPISQDLVTLVGELNVLTS